MTSALVLDLKGNKVREFHLADEVFAVEPNAGLVHTALVRQLANSRAGSASTKTRGEVRGGGAKPWRQKGTGRARAGSIRSPLWEGGGVSFGPKPRDYGKSMPRKMRILAIRSALAARRDNLVIVQDFKDLKDAKTKLAAQVLKALKIDDKKVLIVLDFENQESGRFALAARNLATVKVVHVNNLNVKDLLHCEAVLTTAAAVEVLTNRFKPHANPKGYSEEVRPRPAKSERIKPEKPKVKAEPKAKAEPKDKPVKEIVKTASAEVSHSQEAPKTAKPQAAPPKEVAAPVAKAPAASEKPVSAAPKEGTSKAPTEATPKESKSKHESETAAPKAKVKEKVVEHEDLSESKKSAGKSDKAQPASKEAAKKKVEAVDKTAKGKVHETKPKKPHKK
jgi:large subunit ribosomal protein L4